MRGRRGRGRGFVGRGGLLVLFVSWFGRFDLDGVDGVDGGGSYGPRRGL